MPETPDLTERARVEAEERWPDTPNGLMNDLHDWERAAFVAGAAWAAQQSAAAERVSVSALRYAQAQAVTMRARGRGEDERAWLDLIALLDVTR